MELSGKERLALAEDLVSSVEPDSAWWDAWTTEAARRDQRLESGDDSGLTLDEFWSDEGKAVPIAAAGGDANGVQNMKDVTTPATVAPSIVPATTSVT